MVAQAVPDVVVKAASKSASTLTINGDSGDVITEGDPIGFIHNNVRYYYKADETLTLTGSDDTLKVFLRPRADLSSLSVTADRIKPRCRFQCDFNEMGGRTAAHGLTKFRLMGIEYTGAIS